MKPFLSHPHDMATAPTGDSLAGMTILYSWSRAPPSTIATDPAVMSRSVSLREMLTIPRERRPDFVGECSAKPNSMCGAAAYRRRRTLGGGGTGHGRRGGDRDVVEVNPSRERIQPGVGDCSDSNLIRHADSACWCSKCPCGARPSALEASSEGLCLRLFLPLIVRSTVTAMPRLCEGSGRHRDSACPPSTSTIPESPPGPETVRMSIVIPRRLPGVVAYAPWSVLALIVDGR